MPKHGHMVIQLLTVLGAVNWGLVSLFDFNLVTEVFGRSGELVQGIYVLIGLSGLYMLLNSREFFKRVK